MPILIEGEPKPTLASILTCLKKACLMPITEFKIPDIKNFKPVKGSLPREEVPELRVIVTQLRSRSKRLRAYLRHDMIKQLSEHPAGGASMRLSEDGGAYYVAIERDDESHEDWEMDPFSSDDTGPLCFDSGAVFNFPVPPATYVEPDFTVVKKGIVIRIPKPKTKIEESPNQLKTSKKVKVSEIASADILLPSAKVTSPDDFDDLAPLRMLGGKVDFQPEHDAFIRHAIDVEETTYSRAARHLGVTSKQVKERHLFLGLSKNQGNS